MIRRGISIGAVAAAFMAAAASAHAGVVTYTSTDVPRVIGHSLTVDSTLSVPPGRTAIQQVDVTGYGYSWPASGQELSARLIAPGGASMFLFEIGCFDSPPNASFTLTDFAPLALPEKNGCDDINLVGSSFRPVDPQNKKLSIFNGGSASGTWTLRSVDNGIGFQNQGSLQRWGLRITHAPPVLTVTGPGTANVAGPLALGATANANGVLTLGGDVSGAANLTAGLAAAVPFVPAPSVLSQIRKSGRATASIAASFADETNGTATSSLAVTLVGKKAKKKKKKKRRKKRRGKGK